MTIARMEFYSAALGRQTSYNALLPDVGEGPFPVLFMLHGLSDNHNAWLEQSNLVRHVAGMPLVVILPNGGTSVYLNWTDSGHVGRQNYEDLIMADISMHVRRHFHVTDGPWAIGGLSMGGYGAMRLGLKYADRFASIWSHSSVFLLDEDQLDRSMLKEPDEVDIFAIADRVKASGNAPVISFDCGRDDRLVDDNRAFHEHLQAIGLAHRYEEHEGGHTWDYWDDHVREALAQHAKVLGLIQDPEAK
ncbi:MAG TPA: alpha/beta hydrolase family protein [Thermomicrobiales bacterium]|nr:alpha/beta hydrolase family protein [Thermomicrobiales bacterium]